MGKIVSLCNFNSMFCVYVLKYFLCGKQCFMMRTYDEFMMSQSILICSSDCEETKLPEGFDQYEWPRLHLVTHSAPLRGCSTVRTFRIDACQSKDSQECGWVMSNHISLWNLYAKGKKVQSAQEFRHAWWGSSFVGEIKIQKEKGKESKPLLWQKCKKPLLRWLFHHEMFKNRLML